jgi:ABC-type sugar transport system permease subunit
MFLEYLRFIGIGAIIGLAISAFMVPRDKTHQTNVAAKDFWVYAILRGVITGFVASFPAMLVVRLTQITHPVFIYGLIAVFASVLCYFSKALRYYAFIVPGAFFLGLFTYYPIVWSGYLSFMKWNMMSPKPKYNGLKTIIKLLQDPVFWLVIKNTLIFVSITIIPTMFLAILFAILIDERKKFRIYYIYSLFYPMLIPMAAAAMLWVFIYSPNLGLMNMFLGWIGLPKLGWLGSSDTSLWAIILMTIWKNVGFYTLIYLAGLQNIDKSLYDASYIDGAGWWKRHVYITFPLLGPTSLFVFVVAVILSFRVFAQVHLMTEGGPANSSNVIVYFIYENAFKFFRFDFASALTTILVLTLLAIVLVIFGILHKRIHYAVD